MKLSYLLPVLALLAACQSTPGTPVAANAAPDARAAGELVGPDEGAQKKKAVDSRLLVGVEALRQRDAERARRHITRALEIDDTSPEAHNAMALYYRFEGDDKREEEHYRKAIRYNPRYSQARNNYAALLYRQGRYADAIEQLERAADDTTYDQRQMVFLNLGRSYARAGDADKAIAALQRSLRLDTSQPDALIELAEVYVGQGKYPEARDYYNAWLGRSRQTARSLWLGIRLEQAGGGDKLASYEFQLEQMYRTSPEYQAWRAWKTAGGSLPAGEGKR